MNNIPNDVLEQIILDKVKLFTKESYYHHFRSILLEFYQNIHAFKSKTPLIHGMKPKLKQKKYSSLWEMILIFVFPAKNDFIAENISKKYTFLNPLCFQYLKNLCYTRMKKLTNLANVEHVSIDQVFFLYINLCEKEIASKKVNKKTTFRLKGNILKVNPERRSSLILPRQNSVFKREKSRLYLKKNSDKKGSNIQPLEYDNSYTRLFIGETDEVSVRERYLSNMVMKKQKQFHL